MKSSVKRPSNDPSNSKPTASSSSSTDGKRVKFSQEDDSERPANDVDADDLEFDISGGSSKRKDVVTDGYDSDSSAGGSDDGFGIGGGRKGTAAADADGAAAAKDDDDDDDMFGEETKPAASTNAMDKGKGKEKKEYLDIGDIEGQEFGRDDEEDDDLDRPRAARRREGGTAMQDEQEEDEEEEMEDYLEEDDLANDDDAPRSKRSKASMGYTLSSFNMADELNEGRFSTDGSYTLNTVDPMASHDTWLSGVSKASIKAARESKKRMDLKREEQQQNEVVGEEGRARERDDCLLGLLKIVKEGETVTGTLARLGAIKKRRKAIAAAAKPKVARKPRVDAVADDGDISMDMDTPIAAAPMPSKEPTTIDPITAKIDLLTHLASTLLSTHGELEIYEQSFEDLVSTLKKEGAVRRDWQPPKQEDNEDEAEEEDSTMPSATVTTNAPVFRALIARPTVSLAPSPAPTPPPQPSTASATSVPQSQFFYKWSQPTQTQSIDEEYGPYSISELEGWISGGYFGDGGERIRVRKVGGEGFKSWYEIHSESSRIA